jgi:arylsulfatase A-like enzyme
MSKRKVERGLNRRDFLTAAGAGFVSFSLGGCLCESQNISGRHISSRLTNFIIIFCDDLGYGDIGCFGSKKHRTPNVDRMAHEGMRFTSFYVSSGVCTPSRSSLMTGCYPRRVNMHEDEMRKCVLRPVSKKGLNPNEITIAEILKRRGYATACIGKWHLGDQPKFLPRRQGFDYYYGIPYSNDMGIKKGHPKNPALPLLRNEKVIEAPVDQNTLTKRYTEEAIKFITKNKDKPFFLYLPHAMPHCPVHASEKFRGKSANNGYGDAVEEIDWSTGEILAVLARLGLDKQTLVIFTSDNGADHRYGGSNLPLYEWKGTTFEGGMRIPCVMRWPDKIPAGRTCNELTSTIDLLPTFARLAGTKEPTDRVIDGKDIWPLMSGRRGAKSPHEAFYYYQMDQLQAVRSGKWKLHLPLKFKKRNWGEPIPDAPLRLYDLETDIGETTDMADRYPEVVSRLLALIEKARDDLGDVGRQGRHQRPAGMVVSSRPLHFSSD